MIDWSYLSERYPADEWRREVHSLRDSDYWVFMADALPLEYVRYVLLYLLKEGIVTAEEKRSQELPIVLNNGTSDTRVPQLYGPQARPFIVFNPTDTQEEPIAFGNLGHNDVVTLYVDKIGRIEGLALRRLADGPIGVHKSLLGDIEDEPIYVPPVKMDPSKLTDEELKNLEEVAWRAKARRATKEED